MAIFIISFLAGVLTILAPCVLPMLPIILGGTLNQSNYKRIVTIIVSFMISIIVFTFLLKVSTAFIDIPPHTWSVISGVILILFGIVTLFPNSWERFKLFLRLPQVSGPEKSDSVWGQILLGASLGPIFSTCSPTYTLIIATILPLSLWAGVTSIILYALGLGLVLGAVAIF
jgi:cytochrome c-type biogenesis protein